MAEKKTTAKTAPAPAVETVENPVNKMIDGLVEKAQAALKEFLTLDQEQIDHIVHEMALAGLDKHQELARMAVEETGRGVYEDKVIKNMFATEYIWHDIKKEKTVGVLDENEMEGYVEVAEPVGVIAGVTPTTNPTSTTLFKSLIAVKTRNPIIFGFHPSAQKCSAEAARIVYEAAVKAGAPENCIQWIDTPSIEATGALMNHPGVATILATGGPGMVKAAYSCGKPALGVGPGNVPCYIEKSADLHRACTDLMMSKTFDNGMICASEQAVIVDKEIAKAFEDYMKANNCYFLNKEETEKLTKFMFPDPSKGVYGPLVGKSANWIAEQAGLKVPEKTKILIAPISSPDENHPLAKEKLSPVLAYFVVNSKQQGFDYANKMLELGGLGHSAVIHTGDMKIADEYGVAMRVGRIIVNSPSSQGAIGDIYNTNTPSLTLGCGSYGKNSVSQNVTTVNLINKKRIAKRRVNMQWFKVPPRIYFEEDSIQYLEKMEGISRAFIVTDPMMVKLGNVDKVLYYLRKREEYCHSEIYSDVDGVYTADPRICPRAKKLDVINYDDMLELSGSGAGVLQMRAVEFARKYNVVIHSRSAFSDAEGTYVKEETDMMEEAVITGIAHDTSEVKVTIRGVPDMSGVAAKLFSALAGNQVSVDMIIQNVSEDGITDISFTCPGADEKRACETVERILPDVNAREYVVDEDIAKVSIVGTGMKSSPGIAAKAFQTLGENNINILAISTSPIRLSVVVDGAQTAAAVRCLHTAFGLDSDSVFEETQLSAEEIAAKMNKGR